MKDIIVKNYSKKLDSLGIKHEILKHSEMREVKDVMEYLEMPLSQGYSTLVMKADDDFVSVIRRDDTRLSLKKTRKVLGVKSLRMATSEEFEKLAHLPSGAAYAFLPVSKTLVDKRLFDNEFVEQAI